uniref:50S ribosomal protein L6 n=1 Tax=Marophrys sp. SRT127 TaxID=2488311 RepID=A0A455REH7_9EUKA|nr:50S ribosomal protein L6 [Marophrys sp. SRT127]
MPSFSVFFPILEVKVPNTVRVLISEPKQKNESQIIIMKGRLGQFKLLWSSPTTHLDLPSPFESGVNTRKEGLDTAQHSKQSLNQPNANAPSTIPSAATRITSSRNRGSASSFFFFAAGAGGRYKSQILFSLPPSPNQKPQKEANNFLPPREQQPSPNTQNNSILSEDTTQLPRPVRNKHFVCEFADAKSVPVSVFKAARKRGVETAQLPSGPIKDKSFSPLTPREGDFAEGIHDWPFFANSDKTPPETASDTQERTLCLGYRVSLFPNRQQPSVKPHVPANTSECGAPKPPTRALKAAELQEKQNGAKQTLIPVDVSSQTFGGYFREVLELVNQKKHDDGAQFAYWKQAIKTYITGVTQGYMQTLELKGIGFGATIRTSDEPESDNRDIVPKRSKPGAEFRDTIAASALSGLCLSCAAAEASSAIAPSAAPKKATCEFSKSRKDYLILNLGFSYSLYHKIPKNHVRINIFCPEPSQGNIILIFGVSKYTVNRVAADIYRYKEPEPYKEKGIRYDGEKFFSKRNTNTKKN